MALLALLHLAPFLAGGTRCWDKNGKASQGQEKAMISVEVQQPRTGIRTGQVEELGCWQWAGMPENQSEPALSSGGGNAENTLRKGLPHATRNPH